MDSDKPKRRTRQKDDISGLKYTEDQLRIKLQRYCRVKSIVLEQSSVKGIGILKGASLPKSTTISMREISMIANISKWTLSSFKGGKNILCPAQLKRLIEAIDLVESGRVVKTQAGKYTIYDEPQVEPVREMKISIGGGRILGGITTPKAPGTMPSFDKLFG